MRPLKGYIGDELVGIRFSREGMIFLGTGLIIGFLVLWPIFWLFVGSFLTDSSELTLENWRQAFKAPFLWEATWNTLYVSLQGAGIAIIIGLALAFIVARTDTPGKQYFELITLLPFITPPMISGIAWIILADREAGLINVLFDALGWNFRVNVMSMGGIIFASVLYMIPFVFFITVGFMRQINPELEEASTICGASKYQTYFRVTVPLLLPAITSGALLAFMYSNYMFGIHAVIGLPAKVWLLTTAIYTSLTMLPASVPQAAIQASILLAMGAGVLLVQSLILGKRRSYVTITGKGFRAQELKIGKWRWLTFGICILYVLIVAILPYLVIFYRSLKKYSFQPGMSLASVFQNWDFSEYVNAIFVDPMSQRAIMNSFCLSVTAAIITMTLIGITAYMITKTKVRGRNALGFICMIPLTIPGIVLGVAALIGYSTFPIYLYGTIWILLLAYIVKDLPFGLKAAQSSFMQIDKELEDSARVCGASWLRQFWTVTLPLVKPGMVVGFILIFASIIREIGTSIILVSFGNEVYAYIVFNTWEDGRWQIMSSFIIITTIIVMVFVFLFMCVTRSKFKELTAKV